MTRIAASHPAIWPDICTPIATRSSARSTRTSTRSARCATRRGAATATSCSTIARAGTRARAATCRSGAPMATDLVELRIPVPDRPGVIAEVTTLAGRLGVNIADFEIAHSLEGRPRCAGARRGRGRRRPRSKPALHELGYHIVADRARVSSCPTSSRSAARAAARHACGCPATSGSRTARCSSRRWPTARARSITDLATGDDVAGDAARALAPLGVDDRGRRGAGGSWTAAASTRWREPDGVLDCGNSRHTMRDARGLLAGRPFLTVLTGDESLRTRRCAASSSRCARWAPDVDGRDDGAHAPLVDRRRRRSSGARTSSRSRARR